jgi:diguanylate cyclase (GGDEF)-like protein
VFPLAATVALVIWLGGRSHQLVARGRDVMDGAIIAGSLLVLSWVTTLGSVVAAGASSRSSLILSLAYPVGDLMIATLVMIALVRGATTERTTLALLVLGLGGLSLSDSAYVYLVSTGAYTSGDVITGGWVLGFLMLAAAGLTVRREPVAAFELNDSRHVEVAQPSALRLCLPYVPLVAAGVSLSVTVVRAPSTPIVDLLLGIALVVLVLTRQFLAMIDNQRLLSALADARDQLQHQALHDALTGLANRVLFADRLDRALLQPAADVSVLFCDIDDFKTVNDELGHEAGDDLLELVAKRLRACVRITDTVARLGGDEFAILLEHGDDALEVADRVVVSLKEPATIHGRQVHTSISVGIAHHRGTVKAPHPEHRSGAEPLRRTPLPGVDGTAAAAEREATAAMLLRHADTAMYAAKGAGKSRAVLSDVSG